MAGFGENYRRDIRDVPGLIAPLGPSTTLELSGSPTLFHCLRKAQKFLPASNLFRDRDPVTWLDNGAKTVTSRRIPRKLFDFVDYLCAVDLFRATAARTRVFSASSSIFSPSWKSMARLVFPSRLELKRPEGSFRAAPFAKVILTTFL